ncbi:MAG: hypothetical protein WAW63_03425 [Candidatus Saccharimonadales bacterium]|jgi:hypothetical protein|nr:hypothetical protein [Candidatus Saccharibacteria bacterium]
MSEAMIFDSSTYRVSTTKLDYPNDATGFVAVRIQPPLTEGIAGGVTRSLQEELGLGDVQFYESTIPRNEHAKAPDGAESSTVFLIRQRRARGKGSNRNELEVTSSKELTTMVIEGIASKLPFARFQIDPKIQVVKRADKVNNSPTAT